MFYRNFKQTHYNAFSIPLNHNLGTNYAERLYISKYNKMPSVNDMDDIDTNRFISNPSWEITY